MSKYHYIVESPPVMEPEIEDYLQGEGLSWGREPRATLPNVAVDTPNARAAITVIRNQLSLREQIAALEGREVAPLDALLARGWDIAYSVLDKDLFEFICDDEDHRQHLELYARYLKGRSPSVGVDGFPDHVFTRLDPSVCTECFLKAARCFTITIIVNRLGVVYPDEASFCYFTSLPTYGRPRLSDRFIPWKGVPC